MAVCQPESVSPTKVMPASFVPLADQRDPVWTPLFPAPLKKRIPVTCPAFAGVNSTPSSTGEPSSLVALAGISEPNRFWTLAASLLRVWKDHDWLASVTPSVDVSPDTTTLTVAAAGSRLDGVKVTRVPPLPRVVV